MDSKKHLYDLDAIRNIPILDVCAHLGLTVERRGRNYWCKVRPENQASVILHTDTNYFYDFGNQHHGNNIDLVQYARGNDRVGDAIRELAQAFNIPATQTMEDRLSKPMTAWEYQKIGLYGDKASKNLVFPVATATTEELLDLEYAYRMPMNQLRQEDPEAYRQILQDKAIPYVENKRNCYYMSVWNHYCFLKLFNRQVLFFDSEKTAAKFESEGRSLEQAERALFKACQGTGISVSEPTRLDPQRVLSRLLTGWLEFELGNTCLKDLIQDASVNTKQAIHSVWVSYDAYCAVDTDAHLHAATFCEGKVSLSYPESEKAFFDAAFPPAHCRRTPLSVSISGVEARKQSPTHSNSKEPEPVR